MEKSGVIKLPADMVRFIVCRGSGLCTAAQVLLFACLVEGERGRRFILSASYLAECTGRSKKMVSNAIKSLVEAGYMQRSGRSAMGGLNCFTLNRSLKPDAGEAGKLSDTLKEFREVLNMSNEMTSRKSCRPGRGS